MSEYLFTSESVSEGHPDKVADQISDALVDELLRTHEGEARRNVRAACETMLKDNDVFLGGEISTDKNAPLTHERAEEIVRKTIRQIGYDRAEEGFDADSCRVHHHLGQQSKDIAEGVDKGDKKGEGAGDQGLMFGYACKETESLMPLPLALSHQLMQQHKKVRCDELQWLRPDAKSQVSVLYRDGKPHAVKAVVLSTQHTKEIEGTEVAKNDSRLHEAVMQKIINPVLKSYAEKYGIVVDSDCKFHINPTGIFIEGGPVADCGLTGRKIIVDTYGGSAPHGGGAFSGKDPTKVDRSAAYMMRHVAKSIVAAGFADKCTVQIAYAIGVEEPMGIYVRAEGGTKSNAELEKIVKNNFDLTPRGIINTLKLLNPIYQKTAAYGHFGRLYEKSAEGEFFTWEQVKEI